ncbi:MAG: hypothetical protein ACJA2S_005514 [Cyclobacteriaceae bacterium]|jgi:hypothetical protein
MLPNYYSKLAYEISGREIDDQKMDYSGRAR